jgi:hypothetical protein
LSDKDNATSTYKTTIESGNATSISPSSLIPSLPSKLFEDGQVPISKINEISKMWPTTIETGKLGLCLVVKTQILNRFMDGGPIYNVASNTITQGQGYPYFIFENVRILGTSDAINFDRGSAETQDFSINFIYKRLLPINTLIENLFGLSVTYQQTYPYTTNKLSEQTFGYRTISTYNMKPTGVVI